MAPSLVDLRPSWHLLNLEFEGYKLNLEALPRWSLNLNVPLDKLYPNENQFSFLHTKMFALHNHLFADYWDHRYCLYFIDRNQVVRRVLFDVNTHLFDYINVYDIPAHNKRQPGHFNPCLSFPTHNLSIVSDGTGYLHIVASEGRPKNSQNWQTLYSSLVLGDDKYFILLDSRAEEKNNNLKIHCLLQSIEQNDEHFHALLTWVVFEKEGNIWKQVSMKQLKGKGPVHYAAIESSFSALYIASDNHFKFISDSEREINHQVLKSEPQKLIYTWLQTAEDITISIKLPQDFKKELLLVKVDPVEIKITYSDTIYIEGKLTNKVDVDLTTWNIQEKGQVDILLTKSECTIWKELLEGGDINGEQILDASLVEEVHQRLSHLCSETEVTGADQSVPGFSTQELEECDAASEEDAVLVRLDATNHEPTHRIPLSVHQYLFSITTDPRETPAIALRHDVDACIWQPHSKLPNSNIWPLRHLGTLNAFGYVQSSKQNRKFVTCPPDFSYSVVCESTRHVFIYKTGGNQNCELRNRNRGTGKAVQVGKQYVLNTLGEMLGIHATNNYLFLLNEHCLLAIEII